MKSNYAAIILIFLIYITGDFIRESQHGKKNYSIYAFLSVLATLGVCVYLTTASLIKVGVFEPFWFEDILLIDILVVFTLVFLWKTRNIDHRKLYFGISAIVIFTFLTLFICELLLRAFYMDHLSDNRIGREFVRQYNTDIGIILHKPLPGRDKLIQLNTEKVDFEKAFQLRDYHIIPSLDKREGERRILWLGDSMTEGAQVPREKRFLTLMEKTMGQPHYSLAVGGTSTDFGKVMIDRYYDVINPDIVILGFYPLNDYEEFGRQYSDCGFASLFEPDGDGFRYNCSENPQPLFHSVFLQPPNMLFHYSAYKTVLGNVMIEFRKNIYLRIAEKFYNKPSPFHPPQDFEKLLATNDLKGIYLSSEKAVCSMISEINKDVTARGGVFAVVMIPYVLGDSRYNSEPFNVYPPQLFGNALLDCMSNTEIPFFNLHEAFDKKSLDINNEDTVFLFDRHFNEKGHEKAAELLAPFERELLEIND